MGPCCQLARGYSEGSVSLPASQPERKQGWPTNCQASVDQPVSLTPGPPNGNSLLPPPSACRRWLPRVSRRLSGSLQPWSCRWGGDGGGTRCWVRLPCCCWAPAGLLLCCCFAVLADEQLAEWRRVKETKSTYFNGDCGCSSSLFWGCTRQLLCTCSVLLALPALPRSIRAAPTCCADKLCHLVHSCSDVACCCAAVSCCLILLVPFRCPLASTFPTKTEKRSFTFSKLACCSVLFDPPPAGPAAAAGRCDRQAAGAAHAAGVQVSSQHQRDEPRWGFVCRGGRGEGVWRWAWL